MTLPNSTDRYPLYFELAVSFPGFIAAAMFALWLAVELGWLR